MHRPSRLVAAGATLAFALTALATTPAGAADRSRMTFVNGVPGPPIDLCLNGSETKSGFRYGQVTSRVRGDGPWTLKVYQQDARRCQGTKIAQLQLDLDDDDLTLVITRRPLKILVWDDTPLVVPSPGGALAWRHAADLGQVAFKYVPLIEPIPIGPALDPIWQKGDQLAVPQTVGNGYVLRVTRPDRSTPLARPRGQTIADQRRHEWVFVGTRKKNARIVTFSRPFWVP